MKKKNRLEKDSTLYERIKRRISDWWYNLTQPVYAKFQSKKKSTLSTTGSARRKDMTFYTVMIALPVLQLCIFYFWVNAKSFLMAFQTYNSTTGKYDFTGWFNLQNVVREIAQGGAMAQAVWTSVKAYLLSLVMLPFTIFLPYYIYKKMPGYSFFKIILFLPAVLSTMALGLLYQYFIDRIVPAIVFKITGNQILAPMLDGATAFISSWAFSAIFGFTSVLMYCGAMERIPTSVVEYAKIDGVSVMGEFFYITLPIIWPTIYVYLVSGISMIFTNQMNLYTFYGGTSMNVRTVGYWMFVSTAGGGMSSYPMVSAIGLLFSCIVAPLVFILRRFSKKISRSVEE